MSSAATTGSTAAGFLPASLAALLNLPLDAVSVPAPIGTRSIGSVFSTPPAPSLGRDLVVHTAAPPSAADSAGVVPPLLPRADHTAPLAGLAASAPAAGLAASAPAASFAAPALAAVPPPPASASVPPAASMVFAPQAASSMGSSSPPPFHFGHLITIKLSADNYIFWRAQVLPLLGSHYLLGYVDGSLPYPPALVDSVHGPVYNPAHRV